MEQAPEQEQTSERVVVPFVPTKLGAKDFQVYEPEFKKVFSDDAITNVAISGPFGAGKTSVMNTWEESELGKKHGYLHLSLANFKSAGEFGEGRGKDRGDIEKMLINQLVHKIPAHKIPRSRFRKTPSGWTSVATAAMFALALVLLIAVAAYGQDLCRGLLGEDNDLNAWAPVILWAIPAFVASFLLFFLDPLRGLIKKISFGGGSVELFGESDSAFNRYMDDVLYLFNSSGCDVVVVEDLDRFERIGVFENLREINSLLNAGRKSRKPVRFFYLVRDDMFSSGDRVKFFDLIIPVIPHADPTNAVDILVPELNKAGIKIELSFANELSLYLGDKRIIDDVVNSSTHIKDALFDRHGEDLRPGDGERIVAMSAYKAICPVDYAKLQMGEGYVKHLLDKRSDAIAAAREAIEKRKGEYRGRLREIEGQGKINRDELALLWLVGRYDEIERSTSSSFYSAGHLARLDPSSRIKYIKEDPGMLEKFDELSRDLLGNDDFKARADEISLDSNRESEVLQGRIAELDRESAELARMSLADLLKAMDDDKRESFFEYPAKIRADDDSANRQAYEELDAGLIEYLICSDHINDSYQRYMSNFYPTSISSADREVLRRIVQHSETDQLYGFDEPAASAKKLSCDRYMQKNARILSLFNEILRDECFADKRARFLEGIDADHDIRFLFSYAASDYGDGDSISALERCRPGTLEEMLGEFSDETEAARRVCQKAVVLAPDILEDESVRSAVSRFASSDRGFLRPMIPIASSMGETLKAIGYSAEDLDIDGSQEETLGDVYVDGLYEPSAPLVLKLVKSQHPGCGGLAGGKLSNMLFSHRDWPASKKVDAHPVEYLESAIASFGALDDGQDAVAWLSNKPGVQADGELMKAYASALNGEPIADISAIGSGEAMETFALAGKVALTGRNILLLYAANGCAVTEGVASLFGSGAVPADLTFEEAESIAGGSDFLIDLGMSELISEGVFADAASGYDVVYPDLGIGDLPIDRAKSLVKSSSVGMTEENLSLYARCYPSALVDFAKFDIDGYVDLVLDEEASNCPFDEETALGLMRDGADSPAIVRLVEGFDSPQRIDLGHYSESVNAAIVENCFDGDDLGLLGEMYDLASLGSTEDAVERKCRELLDDVIRNEVGLPIGLRLKLLVDRSIAPREKERLISIGCGEYSVDEYMEMFSVAGLSGYLDAINGKGRYLIDASDESETILTDLERCALVSSHKGDGEGHFVVNAKKKKNIAAKKHRTR